ncbi:methyl-accepting chemotaxis protein [Mediterraneibacter agrestimuris]|uniref:methyl-accepting chemotaxis protein n=1 Tax=Mediterraneibacter agrestimuris TaxID=2941333 RepID=UPI002041D7A3|nr:methyl-accepting chemotaxis protein [Mediterraneibacter agrestimuris]
MIGKQEDSLSSRGAKRSLNGRILRNTTLNIVILVVICCVIMALSLQSLASNILLDSLQPMARQSAKTMEANVHMLADRVMNIASDPRMNGAASNSMNAAAISENRKIVLEEAAEIYEFYIIALYDLNGRLVQGIGDASENLDSKFFSLLKETDNLTIDTSTIYQDKLGVTMGMPVKEDGKTVLYVTGVYKYDILNDVISSINLGRSGMAYMVNQEGIVTGHPDQSMVLNQNTLIQLSGDNEDAAERVATGETGAAEFFVNGKKMLVAFSPIRGTQWALVIQIPKSDYSHFINWAMLISILATLVGLMISMLLILRFARSISNPVKYVTERMVALSDGDLHTDVYPVSTGDELEIMTQTLDVTLESVNRYISDIQKVLTHVAGGDLRTGPQVDYKGDFILIRNSLYTITRSMNETLLGFHSAADRLTAMAEQLSGQSVQLHQASLEQNQSAEELVLEVTHVKARLADVAESSDQTHSQTEEISQRIQSANEQMSSLSSAMDDISANAQQITKIAKYIEDIAFQTNILSINASVEASRAGAAGKGFAVVANEVKQLAAKSADAAKSATEMVNNTKTIIQTGVVLTANTADSLHAISDVSERIRTISDQLTAAVQGQELALTVMEERIATISTIADRNLQNAEETEQSSGSLAKEAEALQDQVQKFKLKEKCSR